MKKLGTIYNGKTGFTVLVFKDSYNPRKIWLVERSKSGHYYYKQIIDDGLACCYLGKRLVAVHDKYNTKWIRTTKKHLIDIGIL